MQFLPIVERELRVAARQPKTWWRRVLTTAAALVLFTFCYLVFQRMGIPGFVGRQTFNALTNLGVLGSLLAGPMATADCLSRERREGTLGLLFLTDLRSHDVVFGKMAAGSLELLFGLVAAIPVVSLSLMLGGSDWGQVTLVALALFDIMCLSLAIGLFASSVFNSGRAAFGFTVLALLFLTVGLPMLGEGVFGFTMHDQEYAWFYFLCPLDGIQCCLDGRSGAKLWRSLEYWLNIGGMSVLSWGLLAIACVLTRSGWRDLPASVWATRWRERLARWGRGGSRFRLAWRRSMLVRNPVAWLDGRDRLVEAVLWSLILGSMILCAAFHLRYPRVWPDQDFVILWPLWTHYILCLMIAIHSPRRLADDKQSGALELLLCTPTQPSAIVRGSMLVLRRRFGRALFGMLVLDAFLAWAHFSQHGGWNGFWGGNKSMPWLALCGLAVFPFQAWCLARVGLYQGLLRGNSLRATLVLAWKLGVLPWVAFAGFLFAWNYGGRMLGLSGNIDDSLGFGSWIAFHLLLLGLFMAQASWQLHRNFRRLAAPGAPTVWWKRRLGMGPW